jgi:hypothetical protein
LDCVAQIVGVAAAQCIEGTAPNCFQIIRKGAGDPAANMTINFCFKFSSEIIEMLQAAFVMQDAGRTPPTNSKFQNYVTFLTILPSMCKVQWQLHDLSES